MNLWPNVESHKGEETHKISPSSKPNTVACKNTRYHEAAKAYKKTTRNDHQTLIENKAKPAEEAAKRGDSRALYHTLSDMVGKMFTVKSPVWDPSGALVVEPVAVNDLWVSVDWRRSILIRLFKKGDATVSGNWRKIDFGPR